MSSAAGQAAHRRYHDATRGRPPRDTLLYALERFDREPAPAMPQLAVDLGCGTGRDTLELLRRGWRVLAVDADAAARAELAAAAPAGAALQSVHGNFVTTSWPATALVNASFCLPLAGLRRFPALWRRIVRSLQPGGRFAGQLYGPRDDWATRPGVCTHDAAALAVLLAGLEVELLREEESDTFTPQGHAKHWHVYHVVARRPGPPR